MTEIRYEVNVPNGISGDFKVVSGDETVLYQNIGGEWMNIMDDSGLEAEQATEFLSAATGDVLLAGLGLGMVLQPLIDNQNVTSITIIEKYQDVIDLVSPHIVSSKTINIVNDDIYTWNPDKNYDVAWFDSYVYPQDGDEPLGDYLSVMTTKYRTVVGSAYFWPGFPTETSYLGW
tara:strand:+ start:3656 stop:4180 length:525 start_codon:yes stop_codon:yes gene_type:complete